MGGIMMNNNMDLATWVGSRILTCDNCGSIQDIFTNDGADAIEGTKCTQAFCIDGAIKSISPLLIPTVTMMNTTDMRVVNSVINISLPHHIEIVLCLKSVDNSLGWKLNPPPEGFDLFVVPKLGGVTDSYTRVSKRIEIQDISDCVILEEVLRSVNALYVWAKTHQ